MQLASRTSSSAEEYIAHQEWRLEELVRCPLHAPGKCSFARHGTYRRATPTGMRVARWYCPQGHQTFSLLPDFMAARLPGLLVSVDAALVASQTSPSIEAAADELRADDVTLPSALRWLRRRICRVREAIADARCIRGAQFDSDDLNIHALRTRVETKDAATWLRRHLPYSVLALVSIPIGFRAPNTKRGLTGSTLNRSVTLLPLLGKNDAASDCRSEREDRRTNDSCSGGRLARESMHLRARHPLVSAVDQAAPSVLPRTRA